MSGLQYNELPSSKTSLLPNKRSPLPYWRVVKIAAVVLLSLGIFAFIYLSWTSWHESTRRAQIIAAAQKMERSMSAALHFEPPDVIRPNYHFAAPIRGKLSCPAETLFPTPNGPPSDVNRVRPADIVYIGALGDSIATGYLSVDSKADFGNKEQKNYVGNSFCMGANDELKSHVTLPNILRSLNPNLTGASHGMGMSEESTGLNVAYQGKWTSDLPRQAALLATRMTSKYTSESIQTDWKLINVFIGTNDIHGLCNNGNATTKEQYKSFMRDAIMIIQSTLPRTIISLIGMWNLDFTVRATDIIFKEPVTELDCIKGFAKQAQKRIEEYREAILELSEEPGLQKADSAVVVQTLFDDLREPLKKASGEYNINFYATDTFHLSKYGNSLVAKALWKQLLTPVGKKKTSAADMADESPRLACPDRACPYIRTVLNSRNCSVL